MAASKVTTRQLRWNEAGAVTLTAVDAADGAVLTPAGDEATVIILSSTAAVTATIKAGDGIQGTSDLTVSVAANSTQYIALESGRFCMTKGADRGKIRVTTSAAGLSAGCLALPR